MQDTMRYLCTGRKKEKKKERIRQDGNRITIFQEVGALQTRLTCSSTKQVTAEHSFASVLKLLILSCKVTAALQVSDGFSIIVMVNKSTIFAIYSAIN